MNWNIDAQALNLIETAFSLPVVEQQKFLDEETAHNMELRARVTKLWEIKKNDESALQTGSGYELVERLSRPSRIGSFKIIDELGSGGMGSVYLGRKESDDFSFYAAIKVVRKDSCSDNLIERLRLERKTLANLRHPNIAHFYDGGETENGHPFFVMEYVKGQKLFDYIKQSDTSPATKLSTFTEICAAVAFAHQNLVIHRDLTPANVLVSDDGVAKLIDFGISQTLGDTGDFKGSHNIGTQGYVAPERNQGQAASTITDIYSLGVILREILENTWLPRKTDLIAIADKASHEEPDKRYQSVHSLLEDLKQYKAGEAVNAVTNSWHYTSKRFIGRHRLSVATAISAFFILICSSIIVSVSYFEADAAEERSRNRFNEVRSLANFMMFDLYDEVEKLDTSLKARELLIDTTVNYLNRLSELPEASQELQVELALGYQRMEDIAGGTGAINFGKRIKADNLYLEAKRQIDLAYSLNPHNPNTVRAYTKIYRNIGTFEWVSNLDFEKARIHFTQAKTVLKKLLNRPEATIDDHVMDGALSLSLSQSARNISDFDNAIAWSKNGIDILKTLHQQNPNHYETKFNLAHAYIYLGEAITTQAYEFNVDIRTAIQPFDKGKQHLKSLAETPEAPTLAKAQYITALYKRSMATCQINQERPAAISDLEKARRIAEKLLLREERNNFVEERLLITLETHADCELREGNTEKALKIAQKVVKRRQAKAQATPSNPLYIARLIDSQLLIAKIFVEIGESNKACEYFEDGYLSTETFRSVSKKITSFRLKSHIGQVIKGWESCQQTI